MYPSVTLCRTQEAIHLDRANGATLENVRAVAVKAAKAWGNEALAAEAREARSERIRLHRLDQPVASTNDDDDDDGEDFNENPDRGQAHA